MARPAEKARSMMNKWVAMREAGNKPAVRRHKRPHLASECDNLPDAERFRGQLIREITKLMEQIQNPAVPEHELRDWNDSINHKMREKWHWNKRIYELGGLDYNAIERQRQLEEGPNDAQLMSGYRYYGAAKNLPGVPELLEKQKAKLDQKARSGSNVYKQATTEYFGWRDEEDGVLLEIEAKSTADLYKKSKKRSVSDQLNETQEGFLPNSYLDSLMPQQEISNAILEQKKKNLLAKYSL